MVSLQRIDHTAIAVSSLDEALERYHRVFGLVCAERATVQSQGVEVAFMRVGDTQIELIQPTESDSGVARFLLRHGEALHHIAIAVDDIRAELRLLEAGGVELIDREPREGLHGPVAFIHPRGTGGVLVELVERPDASTRREHETREERTWR